MSRKFIIAATLLMVVVLISGTVCSSPTATPAPTATPVVVVATPTQGPTPTPVLAVATPTAGPTPTQGAPTVLKFGIGSMLTGSASGWGIPWANGLQMAVETLNGAGGILTPSGKRYIIQPIIYDLSRTVDAGRTTAERLISTDKADIIAMFGTASGLGAAQVTEPNKKLFFFEGSADQVYKGTSYTFGTLESWQYTSASIMPWLVAKYPNTKKIFATHGNDATGQAAWASWKKSMDKLAADKGLDYNFQYYDPGTTDWYPFVTGKVLPYKPDMVLGCWPAGSGAAGAFLKALREAGFDGPFAYVGGSAIPGEMKAAGQYADDRFYYIQEWNWDGNYVSQQQRDLAHTYYARYAVWPPVHFLNAIDTVTILKTAVQKADSVNPENLARVMSGDFTWDSVFGATESFISVPGMTDRKCAVQYPMPIGGIKDGQMVNVALGFPDFTYKQ